MAQQVVIAGAMFNDVPSISVPDSNNVYHPFLDTTIASNAAAASDIASGKLAYVNGSLVTGTASGGGGGQYAWLGSGAEKVGTVFTKTINLKDDTPYDSWTASTSVTTLIAASSTADYTLNADFAGYDYCFVTRGYIEPVYVSGTPTTSRTHRVVQYHVSYVYGYPLSSTTSDVQNDVAGTASSFSLGTNLFYQYYYNGSGVITSRTATQCGPCYMSSAPTATVAFGNGTVEVKLPAFNAKCDSSRFSTTRKGQVDSAATNYYVTIDLYRVPHGNGLISHWVSQACADLNA